VEYEEDGVCWRAGRLSENFEQGTFGKLPFRPAYLFFKTLSCNLALYNRNMFHEHFITSVVGNTEASL